MSRLGADRPVSTKLRWRVETSARLDSSSWLSRRRSRQCRSTSPAAGPAHGRAGTGSGRAGRGIGALTGAPDQHRGPGVIPSMTSRSRSGRPVEPNVANRLGRSAVVAPGARRQEQGHPPRLEEITVSRIPTVRPRDVLLRRSRPRRSVRLLAASAVVGIALSGAAACNPLNPTLPAPKPANPAPAPPRPSRRTRAGSSSWSTPSGPRPACGRSP